MDDHRRLLRIRYFAGTLGLGGAALPFVDLRGDWLVVYAAAFTVSAVVAVAVGWHCARRTHLRRLADTRQSDFVVSARRTPASYVTGAVGASVGISLAAASGAFVPLLIGMGMFCWAVWVHLAMRFGRGHAYATW